jgi:RNA polymerase sigma factor (sigma-70 family)
MHERETLVAMRSAFALETQTSYRVNDNHNQLHPSKYCSIDMGWGKSIVDNGSFALRQQLERLYIDHHAWLSGLLRRKLGNATDAADLAHDIYLNLIRKGSIPAPDDCRCHLTQIAKGMLIDLYRRRRLEASHLERMRQQEAPLGPSEESRALAFEALTQVTAAMNLQPPKARQALLLHRLSGMGHREIASEIKVSVSSVEKYIARAMRACQPFASDRPSNRCID